MCQNMRGFLSAALSLPKTMPSNTLSASITRSSVVISRWPCSAAVGAIVSRARCSGEQRRCVSGASAQCSERRSAMR